MMTIIGAGDIMPSGILTGKKMAGLIGCRAVAAFVRLECFCYDDLSSYGRRDGSNNNFNIA